MSSSRGVESAAFAVRHLVIVKHALLDLLEVVLRLVALG